VRGSGATLGDAETAPAGGSARLDKAVAGLVAGSGADQADQLGDFAVRYVLLRDDAPQEMRKVLDATPARVPYSPVRGSGATLGDAETAPAGGSARLDKAVAGLVAGSGADQADQLG
ncbi:hypothetical protein, partial [Streptomyces sp. WAC05292]|uniref:hypothetical protein n=1 Tax=Streptomyces sp. WAC05292 TaxID=2487418 RepID=UPI0021AE4C41